MFLSLAKKNEFMEFESADLNRVPPLSLFRKSKRFYDYKEHIYIEKRKFFQKYCRFDAAGRLKIWGGGGERELIVQ